MEPTTTIVKPQPGDPVQITLTGTVGDDGNSFMFVGTRFADMLGLADEVRLLAPEIEEGAYYIARNGDGYVGRVGSLGSLYLEPIGAGSNFIYAHELEGNPLGIRRADLVAR